MRKKILAGILAVVMSITMIPGNLMEKAGVKSEVEAAVTLQNPRIVTDSKMTSGQKVTYDCVWFGSYPQTEIVEEAETCGTYGKAWGQSSDYEINSNLYDSLQKEINWGPNGDITLNGIKYRRIRSRSSYYIGDTYYNWISQKEDKYHYFRYEPIKWRVLNVSGYKATLLADKALDCQCYNQTDTTITWEKSTIRSWINGYGTSKNSCGIDYTENNFINSAFSSYDLVGIPSTLKNDNKNSGLYSETYGGEDTYERIYLPSSYDLYNSEISDQYGFVKDDYTIYDEARKCKSTTYAKAMGVVNNTSPDNLGICPWSLRSPGNNSNLNACVSFDGSMFIDGVSVNDNSVGVRPMMIAYYDDSDYDSYYTYAGTVCTDGTENEIQYVVRYDANGGSDAPSSQTKFYGKPLTLSSEKPVRDGYTFAGWGTSNDTTTASYNPEETYNNNSDITLYAIWEKKISLSYDANGGSGEPASESVTIYNASTNYRFIISNIIPVKSGYEFMGWSTSPTNINTTYKEGEPLSLNSDTTLYAIWKKNITLTYDVNGGYGAPSAQNVDVYNSTTDYTFKISTTIPVRDGYDFVGWGTGPFATSTYGSGEQITISRDTTLYAIWKKTDIVVEKAILTYFRGDEEENIPASCTADKGTSVNISGLIPKKTGCDFLGWSRDRSAANASYAPGDVIELLEDVTLYAVWKMDPEGSGSGSDEPANPTPIAKSNQIITASGKTVPINNVTFRLGAKTSGNGKLTYKSSNTKVATISSAGTITVKGYGITNITINAAETSTYKKTSKTVTITVVPKKMKLKSVKSPGKGKLQIKWAKDKVASSYQIQFSQDWKFNSKKSKVYAKTISKKLTALKKPVTGLTSKKKYYVRIRALKKVSGKTLLGVWSATKEIKIK